MLILRWETDSVNAETGNRVLTSIWETDSVNTEMGNRQC